MSDGRTELGTTGKGAHADRLELDDVVSEADGETTDTASEKEEGDDPHDDALSPLMMKRTLW